MSKKILSLMTAAAFGVLLAGCADQKQNLKVGSKPFTESMVLAEMISQLAGECRHPGGTPYSLRDHRPGDGGDQTGGD